MVVTGIASGKMFKRGCKSYVTGNCITACENT